MYCLKDCIESPDVYELNEETSVEMMSLNYPEPYPKVVDQYWSFVSPPGTVIRFLVLDFEVNNSLTHLNLNKGKSKNFGWPNST